MLIKGQPECGLYFFLPIFYKSTSILKFNKLIKENWALRQAWCEYF